MRIRAVLRSVVLMGFAFLIFGHLVFADAPALVGILPTTSNGLCFDSEGKMLTAENDHRSFADLPGLRARWAEKGGVCHGFSHVTAAVAQNVRWECAGVPTSRFQLESSLLQAINLHQAGSEERVKIQGACNLFDQCLREPDFFRQLVISQNSRFFVGDVWRRYRSMRRVLNSTPDSPEDTALIARQAYQQSQDWIRQVTEGRTPVLEVYSSKADGFTHSVAVVGFSMIGVDRCIHEAHRVHHRIDRAQDRRYRIRGESRPEGLFVPEHCYRVEVLDNGWPSHTYYAQSESRQEGAWITSRGGDIDWIVVAPTAE